MAIRPQAVHQELAAVRQQQAAADSRAEVLGIELRARDAELAILKVASSVQRTQLPDHALSARVTQHGGIGGCSSPSTVKCSAA